ncbi:hypothetical protein [Amycolatopsis aidingensis]|uniref:hypothetical protein n=1 Tax=Amycolatopsis aidingensis TaxID=2842453 RepID=UPI001C0B6664|nr:hypothetical protein [Amycolatopsis aidingensis]
MDTTVAVALITSLSTLTAAALTGTISAWSNARQLRHQRLLAREQRAEERNGHRRELRRAAYQQFLAEADAAYRVLDEGWLAAPFTEPAPWKAGFAARRALDEAYIRVQLEGPDEVAAEGAKVVRGIGEEFTTHRRVLDANPGTPDSAVALDAQARAGALRVRFQTSKDFIAAARHALGEEPPQQPERLPEH